MTRRSRRRGVGILALAASAFLALPLASCGDDDPSVAPEQTAGAPADSIGAGGTDTSGPVQSRGEAQGVPDWAVPASLSAGLSAASPLTACQLLYEESDEPSSPTVVLTSTDQPRALAELERGSVMVTCLPGFDVEAPVEVTLTLPDGTRERVVTRSESTFRVMDRDAPVGTWTVRAIQGDRSAAADIEVVVSVTPRVLVLPYSTQDEFFVATPQVPPGEPHHVLFTGFDDGEQIRVALYEGGNFDQQLVESFEVEMDDRGSALLTIATDVSSQSLWRCLALEPDVERRVHPDATPDSEPGAASCRRTLFTTRAATAAVVGLYCDGVACEDAQPAPTPRWRVVGVEADDPDGGLNVRAQPRAAADNVTAVLRWDATGVVVEDRDDGWSAIRVVGWVDDDELTPDASSSCPQDLLALRVANAGRTGGVAVSSSSDGAQGRVVAELPGVASVCGAPNAYGEGRRQVVVSGWVGSSFLAEEDR